MVRQVVDRLCALSAALPTRSSMSLFPSSSSSTCLRVSFPSDRLRVRCASGAADALGPQRVWQIGRMHCCSVPSVPSSQSRTHDWSCLRRENLVSSRLTTTVHKSLLHMRRKSPVCVAAAGSGDGGGPPRETPGDGVEELEQRELLVQHLLVKEDQLQLLLELEKQLREGVDLSDLAVEHSLCPSKEQGGMIGWIGRGKTVPEFEEAAFAARVDKVVRVKTKFGWHLLRVLAEREVAVVKEMGVVELGERLRNIASSSSDDVDAPQLVDVRELSEMEMASLPYFRAFPLSQFGKWGPSIMDALDVEKETIVLCHHGVRSLQMAEWLRSQGFRDIKNVTGGINAYSREVDSSVPTY